MVESRSGRIQAIGILLTIHPFPLVLLSSSTSQTTLTVSKFSSASTPYPSTQATSRSPSRYAGIQKGRPFIVGVQSKPKPHPQEMSYKLLKIAASASLWNISAGNRITFPEWGDPDSTVGNVQAEMRGPVIDCSPRRQRKTNRRVTWHPNLAMMNLFLLPKAAPLLGYALSNYLHFINKVTAVCFAPTRLLFYLIVVYAAVLSYTEHFDEDINPPT